MIINQSSQGIVDILSLAAYSTTMIKILSKNTIRGIGSVMNIFPAKSRYVIRRRLPKKTDSENLKTIGLELARPYKKLSLPLKIIFDGKQNIKMFSKQSVPVQK